MFSFHKPRVYRSTEGCCICRAKSSSSRFTDSKKYEDDSVKCFNLEIPRQGEICNACVLLVKRFKRLPVGSNRHWGHVVDARIGPGMKSMTKFKKLREESLQQNATDNNTAKAQTAKSTSSSISEKFCKIFKKNKKKKLLEKIVPKEKREGSPGSWDEQSLPPTPESLNSDGEDVRYSSSHYNRAKFSRNRINRRKIRKPRRYQGELESISFFDASEWKTINSCCGVAYENSQFGALIIDTQKYKPCSDHVILHNVSGVVAPTKHSKLIKTDTNNIERSHELKYQLNLDRPVNNILCKEEMSIPSPVLKKHHLFFKRQLESFPGGDISVVNSIKTDLDSTHNKQIENKNETQSINITNKIKPMLLHKVKSDTGKIVKHSLEKINALRVKQADLSDIKNLIKIAEKPNKQRTLEETLNGQCNKQTDQPGNKFSDNSSDSGFDENLQERKSVSPMQQEEDVKEKKVLVRPAQAMFLANGVQIQSQPQNIILTASEVAARMLQSRRQQLGTTKYAQNSGSQKIRAIFNPSTEGIVTLAGASTTPTTMLSVTPSATSLNQKIIFVKAKYNNQPSSTN